MIKTRKGKDFISIKMIEEKKKFIKAILKKTPSYQELLKENQKYKEVIDKIYTIINYEKDFYDSKNEFVSDLERLLKEVEHE